MFAQNAESQTRKTSKNRTSSQTLKPKTRIALIGNTLFDRIGILVILKHFFNKDTQITELILRNLAWSADEIDLQPRPDNFADTNQHLTAMKADLIIAAFGYNESFAGVKKFLILKLS